MKMDIHYINMLYPHEYKPKIYGWEVKVKGYDFLYEIV